VSARREGDAVILEVEGALAGASVTEFQRAANDAVETPAHLVIDLSGATALDARAVGALIYLPKRAAFTGREVRIAGASGRALRALRAGGVESSVPCHPRVVDSMGTLPRDPGADARPAGFEESR
jgi:anti-anti-sigma factor